MTLEIEVADSRLIAVPSVHYRAVFAEQVNRACRDAASRPNAIAVELGAGTVRAITDWMRELGVEGGGRLPCMLGLTRPNRHVHPQFKETAVRLQERWGLAAHELPPHVLRERLHFSALSLVCLSATDSIIEAIRSAVELGIPVHGVDLEEYAQVDREPVTIEDPVEARLDLRTYVDRNGALAASGRDAWVDGRRERAMAARLKFLLEEHERVLFVGGLAHWPALDSLLANRDVAASAPDAGTDTASLMRVVVHPSIAIQQMDLFPDFTSHFEGIRGSDAQPTGPTQDHAALFREKLAGACGRAAPQDRGFIPAFTQYLTNLCLTNQRSVPDLFTTVAAAAAMGSQDFANRLGEALVSEALDWADGERFPELPYLHSIPSAPNGSALAGFGVEAQITTKDDSMGPLFVAGRASDQRRRLRAALRTPQSESPRRKRQVDGRYGGLAGAWPPSECIYSATAYQAAQMAFENASRTTVEPFSGSMALGLDAKATLRSFARGDRRTFVRVGSSRTRVSPEEAIVEPVVFILAPEDTAYAADWELLLAGVEEEIRPRVRNPKRFDEVVRDKGDQFVCWLQYRTRSEAEPDKREFVISEVNLWGGVSFGNPCLNALQGARWLEDSNYACGPIVKCGTLEHIVEMYELEHGIQLQPNDWTSTLVRLAIPYARERVVVVAADGFQPAPHVCHEARTHGKQISVVPLSNFAADRIAAVRRQYYVYSKDAAGMEYDERLEAILGQKSDAHLELLPDSIRQQLVLNT